jgi:hypothetical protein
MTRGSFPARSASSPKDLDPNTTLQEVVTSRVTLGALVGALLATGWGGSGPW